jgi:DNA invertase Pin-like site-specific DNA recombinase
MRSERGKTTLRCAIYTRVSTEHGLEQEFNSLDNQREASEAYIKSQAHEGWKLIRTHYDDGGCSGGSMDRPALKRLLDDVRAHRIDVIVVYKVDRLTRSLADFAKLVELFDTHQVSFVSVTQAFNTTTSMGRLTLNVLLSFAQFEREVTGERIRDKIAASKKKGIWMGGGRSARLSGREPGAPRCRGACRLHSRSLSALSRDRQRRAVQSRPGSGERPAADTNRWKWQDDGRGAHQPGPSLQASVESDLPWAADTQGPSPRWSSRSDR